MSGMREARTIHQAQSIWSTICVGSMITMIYSAEIAIPEN